jgi:hypothetical protein
VGVSLVDVLDLKSWFDGSLLFFSFCVEVSGTLNLLDVGSLEVGKRLG